MPDGSISTTFLARPDEILTFLQVGRHVNSNEFSTSYDVQRVLLAAAVLAPIAVDVASDSSYFKFNLDYISFYNLIRLETSSTNTIYRGAYTVLRGFTSGDQNAFFDVIDRGLNGPNAARDAETMALLNEWLQRSRRDPTVNLNGVVPVCGSQACNPIPVALRPRTIFCGRRARTSSREAAVRLSKRRGSTTFCRIGWRAITELFPRCRCSRLRLRIRR